MVDNLYDKPESDASSEYQEGQLAFKSDKEPINNPYLINSTEAEAWDHGWWDAYEREDGFIATR